MTAKTETKWHQVPCPCGKGTIPGNLYEAGKRTCGNEEAPEGLTLQDILDGYKNDGWLGWGYLGERERAYAAAASGDWQSENITAADAAILDAANALGWTAERLFEDFLNAKTGRWYADETLGSNADPVAAIARYIR